MEENIFKKAEFGDHFKSRDGVDGIYLAKHRTEYDDGSYHYLVWFKGEEHVRYYTSDGGLMGKFQCGCENEEWDSDIIPNC